MSEKQSCSVANSAFATLLTFLDSKYDDQLGFSVSASATAIMGGGTVRNNRLKL
jgi:uncharacterized membrane protein YeiH